MNPNSSQSPASTPPPTLIAATVPPRTRLMLSALRICVLVVTLLIGLPLLFSLALGEGLDLQGPCCGIGLAEVLDGLGSPTFITSFLSTLITRDALIGLALIHLYVLFVEKSLWHGARPSISSIHSARIASPNGVMSSRTGKRLDEFS